MSQTVLKPYRDYRDSGVPWLRAIPEHWALKRLRHIADLRVSNVDKKTSSGQLPVRLCNYVDVYKNEVIHPDMLFMRATATAGEINRFKIRNDDVLITKDSEDWKDIGVPALATGEADDLICGYHLAILRARSGFMQGPYLYWQMRSELAQRQFRVAANGITRYGLSRGAINDVLTMVPPHSEQQSIANFLGHSDQRINRLIRTKRRQIELLNEQKQSIIHRAVTRGLDPDAPLKPSGIDWLGDVPAHWAVKRNFLLFTESKETSAPDLPVLMVSLRTGVTVIPDVDQDGRPRRLIQDRAKYKAAKRGDLAYNMMRMWQGAVGVSPVDGLVSPAYVVARPNAKASGSYFSLVFRTDAYKNYVYRNSHGIVDDRHRLYWEEFKTLRSPVPPISEQLAIVSSVSEQLGGLDLQIRRIERQTEVLAEYRSRVVADVVTGQLDVSGHRWVTPTVEFSSSEHGRGLSPEAPELLEEFADAD